MEAGMISGIATAFVEGGIWMYAILAAHIAAVAIVAERVSALFLKSKPNQKAMAKSFEEDIKSGKMDVVISKARAMAHSEPVASVILAGAIVAKDLGTREEIQAKMDEVLATENAKLEKRTGFLAMLGNVGTLLGLLGTIIGLIQAFSAVVGLSAAEKSLLLTKGVALAMNTTAYGLIMAIPTLIMHAVLVNRSNELQEDLNQGSFKALNWMSFNNHSVPTVKSKSSKNA